MSAGRMALTFGAGVLGGLATLVAAMQQELHLAVAMPIGLLAGAMVFVRPGLGLAFLLFFALIDGFLDLIFAALPVSVYKLISAATIVGTLLLAATNRWLVHETLTQPMARLGLAFAVCIFISTLFAIDKGTAADSGLRLMSVMVLMYLVMVLLQDDGRLYQAAVLLVCSMVVSAVILMIELSLGITLISTTSAATSATTAEGFARSSGASQYDPTTAAIMLLVGIMLAFLMALESRRHRGFFLLAALIGSAAIVFSFSRSAALVLGIMFLLIAVRYRRNRLMVPGLLVFLFMALALLPFVPASYFERFWSLFSFGEGDWTLSRRWTYQVIGIQLLFDYPIFGVGPGNYKQVFTDPAFRYLPGRTLLERPLHNMYLSVAVEYGLVGFTVFMGILMTAFRTVLSVIRTPCSIEMQNLATAILFAMLAFFMASVFNPNEYNKFTWILIGLAGVLGIVNARAKASGTGP